MNELDELKHLIT